jgi:hypothetical protein
MTRVFAAVLLVLSVACEKDANKLTRLQRELRQACAVPDSLDVASAKHGRLQSEFRVASVSQDVPAMAALLDSIKVMLRRDSTLLHNYAEHPEQAKADSIREVDARTQCTLSRRALNQFMAGR